MGHYGFKKDTGNQFKFNGGHCIPAALLLPDDNYYGSGFRSAAPFASYA